MSFSARRCSILQLLIFHVVAMLLCKGIEIRRGAVFFSNMYIRLSDLGCIQSLIKKGKGFDLKRMITKNLILQK